MKGYPAKQIAHPLCFLQKDLCLEYEYRQVIAIIFKPLAEILDPAYAVDCPFHAIFMIYLFPHSLFFLQGCYFLLRKLDAIKNLIVPNCS